MYQLLWLLLETHTPPDDNEQHMTQLPPHKLFVSFYQMEGFFYAKK